MREVWALTVKDLRLLLRDKAGFFFTFFFPLIIAIFFGTIFSGSDRPYSVPVVLVDEDGTAESKAFLDSLAAAPIIQARTGTREAAVQTVRLGKSTAYIIVKPGFAEASKHAFWGPPPSVELGIDPARRADAAILEGVLMEAASKRFERIFTDATEGRANLEDARQYMNTSGGLPPALRSDLGQAFDALDRFYQALPESSGRISDHGAGNLQPIEIARTEVTVRRSGPTNAYAITFPQGIVWGFIGVTAAFGISIITERAGGTLLRLQVAPVTRGQILAGKALATFITAVTLAVGLFALAFFAFKVKPESLGLLALAIVSSGIAFVGIMMLLSVLGKTEQAASGIGWAVLLVFSMLGGGMIPYFFMPGWMRTLSNVSPVKWSILAMEGAVWRGFSATEMLLPCGILVAVGAAFFSIGVRVFGWTSEA